MHRLHVRRSGGRGHALASGVRRLPLQQRPHQRTVRPPWDPRTAGTGPRKPRTRPGPCASQRASRPVPCAPIPHNVSLLCEKRFKPHKNKSGHRDVQSELLYALKNPEKRVKTRATAAEPARTRRSAVRGQVGTGPWHPRPRPSPGNRVPGHPNRRSGGGMGPSRPLQTPGRALRPSLSRRPHREVSPCFLGGLYIL